MHPGYVRDVWNEKKRGFLQIIEWILMQSQFEEIELKRSETCPMNYSR